MWQLGVETKQPLLHGHKNWRLVIIQSNHLQANSGKGAVPLDPTPCAVDLQKNASPPNKWWHERLNALLQKLPDEEFTRVMGASHPRETHLCGETFEGALGSSGQFRPFHHAFHNTLQT